MKLGNFAVALVLTCCIGLFSCKKNHDNTSTTVTTTGTYAITCWNKMAGEITNFRSNNALYQEKWDFGDGATLILPLGSGAGNVGPIDHIYKAPGIYTVKLTVNNDSSHNVIQSDTITPNFNFNYNGVPVVGDTITFYFKAYLPAGVSYLWTFGDGTSSTDSTPYHIYNSNGSFDVKLTINGNPTDPDIWMVIPIYKDPIYTRNMTNTRLWHGSTHNYNLYDSASYNVYATLPDSTFALTYVNEVVVTLGYIQFTFNPSLSSNDIIVFSSIEYGATSNAIYYNHVNDSVSVALYQETQSGPGQPPVELDIGWHSP